MQNANCLIIERLAFFFYYYHTHLLPHCWGSRNSVGIAIQLSDSEEEKLAWERFQDELERIKGENTYEDLHDFEDKSFSSQQETSTPRRRTLQ